MTLLPLPQFGETELQILRDVQRFSTVKRYHGLLPEKYALLYDQGTLHSLLRQSLLESGMVLSRCGSKLHGYRLTDQAATALRELGLGAAGSPMSCSFRELQGEELDCLDLQILADVLHYSRIRRNGGLCPKDELYEDHGKKDVKRLYEMGLLLYVKLKDAGGKSRKGYVLSELGRRIMDSAGQAA